MVIGVFRNKNEIYFGPTPAFIRVQYEKTGEYITSIWREWWGSERNPTVIFKGKEYDCLHSNHLISLSDLDHGLFIEVSKKVVNQEVDRDTLRQEILDQSSEYFLYFVKGYFYQSEKPDIQSSEGRVLEKEFDEWGNLYINSKLIALKPKNPEHAKWRKRTGFLTVINDNSGLDVDYVQRKVKDGIVTYRGEQYPVLQLGNTGNCIKVPETALRANISIDRLASEIISKKERDRVLKYGKVHPRLLRSYRLNCSFTIPPLRNLFRETLDDILRFRKYDYKYWLDSLNREGIDWERYFNDDD